METIKTSIKDNKIVIEITPQWLLQESKNKYWRSTHYVGEVNNEFDAAEYVVEKLVEPSVDIGNGEVSPVAYMLMDILEKAYSDGEDFMDEIEDDE